MKYVNVKGKRIVYDARMDYYPYCYFDLSEKDIGIAIDVVKAVFARCKRKFKSAEISSFKALKLLNNKFEFKVIFRIKEGNRNV